MLPFQNVSSNVPLLQGDILKWHKKGNRPFREEFSLVLNADCDLFAGKIPQQITALPIITLKQYIYSVWPSEEFSRIHAQIQQSISSDIERIVKREKKEFSGISADLLEEIICSDSATIYISELPFKNKKEKINLERKIECANHARKILSTFGLSENLFSDICKLYAKFSNITQKMLRRET
jgi:hypothetical protein